MIHSDQTTIYSNPAPTPGAPGIVAAGGDPAPRDVGAGAAQDSGASDIQYDDTGDLVLPAPAALPAPDAEMPSAGPAVIAGHRDDTRVADRLPPDHPRRWTRERQEIFIEILAYTGCVSEAALAAGMSRESAYRLRRHPNHAAFAECWESALVHAAQRLTDIAFERCFKGTAEELFDADGTLKAVRRRRSDRLLIHMIEEHISPLHGGPRKLTRSVDLARAHAAKAMPKALAALRDEAAPDAIAHGTDAAAKGGKAKPLSKRAKRAQRKTARDQLAKIRAAKGGMVKSGANNAESV